MSVIKAHIKRILKLLVNELQAKTKAGSPVASGSSPPSALLRELTPPDRPRTSVPPRAPGLRVAGFSASGSVQRQPDLRGALPGAVGHTLILLLPITSFLSCRFLSSFHLASWVSESFEVERWCVQVVMQAQAPFSAVHLGKSLVSRSLCNHSYYKFLVIWEITP